ncbi:benzoate para-hydroxylase [Roridomyces roridus]|uniref:Benzoate para-hydroxylase n=1 Tax=Roridomyces roridus TaxID=1738132 RepID=A0AAD7BPX0_9AGAR|nr:benzoate para-hydroxylase [Roridomyces roridus]
MFNPDPQYISAFFPVSLLPVYLASASILLTTLFLLLHDPLRHIPGPALARWTPLWLGHQARVGNRYLAIDSSAQKFGPIIRIAPGHVSVAHADAVGVVYSHAQGSKPAYEKSTFYDSFIAGKPSVFSTRDRKDHSYKRRIVAQAFSYRALEQFSPFIKVHIAKFIDKMDSFCITEESLNIVTWIHYMTFDVLSDLAFGEPGGMLASGSSFVSVQKGNEIFKDEDAIALIDGREHLSAVLGISPWFPWLAKIIPDSFYSNSFEATERLSDLARQNVIKRMGSGTYRADILGKLIEAHLSNGEEEADMIPDLVAETVTLLTAGSDTTASSTSALIYLVATHRQVYRKLLGELMSAVDGEAVPSAAQVKDCIYLQAVVNEGLRVYSTVSTGLPRVVPEGGVEFLGVHIPAGTEISVPAFTIQHDKAIWGDPEVFRPERWLQSAEQAQYLSRYLLPFSKGPRACVTSAIRTFTSLDLHIHSLAYMEIQLILATVILRYKIELQSELESMEAFAHKATRLMVKLSLRG